MSHIKGYAKPEIKDKNIYCLMQNLHLACLGKEQF